MEQSCKNCYTRRADNCDSTFSDGKNCPNWRPIPKEYWERIEQKKKDVAKAQENCRTCIHKKVCRFNYPDVSKHGPIRVKCKYKEQRREVESNSTEYQRGYEEGYIKGYDEGYEQAYG